MRIEEEMRGHEDRKKRLRERQRREEKIYRDKSRE